MGIFNTSSPFDADIEKATSENNTSEQWGAIMDVCDKVGTSATNAKDCLRSIVKRLQNADPHVVVQAITLLDACVNNCGKNFHLEVASRDFENEYRRLLTKSQVGVSQKLRCLIKKWAEGEFKSDPQLNLIPSLYKQLKGEGMDFSDPSETVQKQPAALSRDPNVVSSQQEQDDIAKAIELSLKDKNQSPRAHNSSNSSAGATSLYPSMALSSTASPTPEARKVRALYDFEAAEDNELTFLAGEIIHVQDDSDPNWWKGFNQRGEGLFPANFVTADLSVEPEQLKTDYNKKSVQFNDSVEVKTIQEEIPTTVEINEGNIDRLLHLLHEANPEDPSADTDEMLSLEAQVNHMGPLIDSELERIDRKHAQLTQLSSDLVEALNFYHSLMREPERPSLYSYTQQPLTMPAQMYPTRGFTGAPPTSMGLAPGSMSSNAGMFVSMGPPMQLPHMVGLMVPPGQMGPINAVPVSIPPQGPMAQQMGPSMSQMGSNQPQMSLSNMNQPQMPTNPQMMNSNPQQILPPSSSQMGPQNPSQLGPNNAQLGPNPQQMMPNIPHGMIPNSMGPPHQIMQQGHMNGPNVTPNRNIGPVGLPQTQMGPEDPRQNIPYQPRVAPNHFMQGPTALPGHM